MNEEQIYTEDEAHKHFGVTYNNRVWALLEKEDRNDEEGEEMLHSAHASHLHWLKIGTPVNAQRGNWMLSRVYAERGYAEAALRYAKQCRRLTQDHADLMEGFDVAYSMEALARAYAIQGDKESATNFYNEAQKAGNELEDEDRKIFDADLKGGHWGGLF